MPVMCQLLCSSKSLYLSSYNILPSRKTDHISHPRSHLIIISHLSCGVKVLIIFIFQDPNEYLQVLESYISFCVPVTESTAINNDIMPSSKQSNCEKQEILCDKASGVSFLFLQMGLKLFKFLCSLQQAIVIISTVRTQQQDIQWVNYSTSHFFHPRNNKYGEK